MADTGQHEAVALLDGAILDGRHRRQAAVELGFPLLVRNFSGDAAQALDYVLARHLAQRQLSTSQKAALSVSLLERIKPEVHKARCERLRERAAGRVQEQGDRSRAIVAGMLGIGDRSVQRARKLAGHSPEAIAKVLAGELTLNKALAPFEPTKAPPPLTSLAWIIHAGNSRRENINSARKYLR